MTAREGCPAWCSNHYRTVYSERLTVEGHAIERWVKGRILIQVLQSLGTTNDPTLHVQGGQPFPLDQAAAVAHLLRQLGHGDEAAAAVEDLAALVGGPPANVSVSSHG